MSALTYDRYARQPRLVGFWEFALIVWIPACLAVVPVVTRAGDGNRPVDLRELAVECASPFDVGNRAQLFVDRLLVHETQRVAFTLHPGKKHSRNPLVVCDKPWEGWRLEIYGSVIYDKEEQIFKMWYIGESPKDFPNYATHYATSQDGIHWKKPLVGTVESLRGGKHNAVAEGYLLASVIKDGADPDPARRYKMICWRQKPPLGAQTMISPDGLHWTQVSKKPICRSSDVITGYYDQARQMYVAFPKLNTVVRGHSRRCFGLSLSKDFLTWTEPQLVFAPDARDDAGSLARLEAIRHRLDRPDDPRLMRTEFYGIGAYSHESCTMAFPWVLTINNNARYGNHEGPAEIQLAVSRDLLHWERPFRTPVIPIYERGAWDESYQQTSASAIRVGDEIWLYYCGANYTHGTPVLYRTKFEDGTATGRKTKYTGSIGLVKWPLDRFVSVDGPAGGGTLTTVPVKFQGERLVLNASSRKGGSVTAELLTAAGKSLKGFERSDPFRGDDLRHVVTFGGRSDVSQLAGKPVVLRFQLRDAELYSFAFRKQRDLPAAPKANARLSAGKPLKIVCFGDSVTGVYYHTGGRRAYTTMIGLGLKQLFPASQVTAVNAGISGHTTRNALQRIERDVLDHKPQLVTVMFGLNDMVGVPLDEFGKNLEKIIAKCRDIDAEVILCTPNSVIDTSSRPIAKLVKYCDAIRQVGRQQNVPVSDCYQSYEELHAKDPQAWRLLMSDEIHPNMDGHKRIAEVICLSITGRQPQLKQVVPPRPAVPKTLAKLKAKQPIKVLAMPPYDALIEPALKKLDPNAQVTVVAWPIDGKTLPEIELAAKKVRQMEHLDLVLIAVPTAAEAKTTEQFIRYFSWVMNWSLSFDYQKWDVVAIGAEVATPNPGLSPAQKERNRLMQHLIRAQDLSLIARSKGDDATSHELLANWLQAQQASASD